MDPILAFHVENQTRWLEKLVLKIPHAILICAPEGMGENLFAKHLARVILCRKKEAVPCEQCEPCTFTQQGKWLDLQEIAPDPESHAIKIDQVREMKEKIGFSSFQSDYRIVLINQAHLLNLGAANSLLKLLEEPPPQRVFILTATDPTLLLPTVISRCQKLTLKPMGADRVERWLLSNHEIDPKRARESAVASGGNPGLALQLCEDTSWEIRTETLQFMRTLNSQRFMDSVSSSAKDLEVAALWMESALHQAVTKSLPQSGLNPGLDANQALTGKEGAAEVLRRREKFLDELSQLRAIARTPVNKKILVQSLASSWLETSKR